MRILVFGKSGQVATELARQADVIALGRDEADLSDPAACAAAIAGHAPEAVINAAAYTAVDKAEEEEDLATTINGAAPAAMAGPVPIWASRSSTSRPITCSTARRRPVRPDAPTAPLGAYGRSKLAGETGVRAAGGAYAILRTSWVVSAHGANFVKTMLRVGPAGVQLRVVDDQIGGPTPAADIAAACLKIAAHLAERSPGMPGIYHFAGAPDTSWAAFADAIFDMAQLHVAVEHIPTTEYPLPAPRPLNSRLDCSTTEAVFGIPRPDWRAGLADILHDLSRQGGTT
jgi:dTDP-4-dehydrorhamnose reductase